MAKQYEQWRSFLFTLQDDVFFNVIRNYLGPVQTPYNKHDLIDRLCVYLQQAETRREILLRLQSGEIELLSAIELLSTDSIQKIFRFFDSDGNPARLYTGLLNLTDRLLIFRDAVTGVITINPYLLPGLRDAGMNPASLFPSRSVQPPRMEISWFNDNLTLAALSLLNSGGELYKSDGGLRKAALNRFTALFTCFNGAEGELVLGRFLASLEMLGLLKRQGGELLPLLDNWTEWARLSRAERHFHYWSAYALLSSEGKQTVDQGESLYLLQQQLTRTGTFLREFLSFPDGGRGYSRETLLRVLHILAGETGFRIHGGPVLSSLGELGLLHHSDRLYVVNPAVQRLNATEDGGTAAASPPASGPSMVAQSDYRINLQPQSEFSGALLVAATARIINYDIVSQYELSRDSVFAALSAGLPADSILPGLKEMGSLPQNLEFSIGSWIAEFRSVELRSGYLISTTGKTRTIVAHIAGESSDVRDLGNGNFLFPSRNLDWVDELEDKGIHVRTLLNLDRDSGDEDLPPFMSVSPSAGSRRSRRRLSALHSNPSPGDNQVRIDSATPRDDRGSAGAPGADSSGNIDIKLEALRRLAREMQLNEDVEKEILLRIDNGLILQKDQISDRILRPDITEARGLNYNAKLRLIEMALTDQDMLEFYVAGRDEPLLLKPVRIHKKPGNAGDLLEARQLSGDEELMVHISKARLIRRLKGNLFHRL